MRVTNPRTPLRDCFRHSLATSIIQPPVVLAIVLSFLFPAGSVFADGPAVHWGRTFGGSGSDICRSVQQTSDGGYILAGFTESYGAGSRDVYLVKTDSSGNMEWDKTFGGTAYDDGYSAQQTSDGGYIIVGYTESLGPRDMYLVKTDSAGNMLWQKTIGGSRGDTGYTIKQTSDGGYIIIGSTCSYGTGGGDNTCADAYLGLVT